MPPGTIASVQGRFLIDDTSISKSKQRSAIATVLKDSSEMTEYEQEIQNNDLFNWSRKLYRPRAVIISDEVETVIGCLIYEDGNRTDRQISIHNVRIDPKHRGAGAGSAAIAHLKETCRTNGWRLAVYNMLDSAKPFYARNGADVEPHSAMAEFSLDI